MFKYVLKADISNRAGPRLVRALFTYSLIAMGRRPAKCYRYQKTKPYAGGISQITFGEEFDRDIVKCQISVEVRNHVEILYS